MLGLCTTQEASTGWMENESDRLVQRFVMIFSFQKKNVLKKVLSFVSTRERRQFLNHVGTNSPIQS